MIKFSRITLTVVCLALTLNLDAQNKKTWESITPDEISRHLNYLASDEMMGRKTPGDGLDSAANYISNEFKSYGLLPLNNSYFQQVALKQTSLGDSNLFEIIRDEKKYIPEIKTDFIPFEMTGNIPAEGSLVFAGYGITAPEYNYNDYSDIDVKGKIVVILQHKPGENDSTSVFGGITNSKFGRIKTKVQNAKDHGATGIIIVTDPLNHILLSPSGFPWPSLSKHIPNDALPIEMANSEKPTIPVIHAGKKTINFLFGSVDSLKAIQEKIDENLQPNSFELKNIFVRLKTNIVIKPIEAKNVVAFLPGTEPEAKDEIVIIGAHYDHVGYNKNQTEGDNIFNGADDNASGTASVMAIARTFSECKVKPKRSILFIAFTAEEIGLFGSKWYVDNPILPLQKTVAMLNFDMIGRNSPDSLYLEGSAESPDIASIIKKQNKKLKDNFVLVDGEFSGGSDHAPFYNKDIAFMFFFAGLHNDYHTVRDNPDLINFEKAARVSQLGFLTAWYIANDKKYYSIKK